MADYVTPFQNSDKFLMSGMNSRIGEVNTELTNINDELTNINDELTNINDAIGGGTR